MSEEYSIELYQAFASTKPTEFDAFVRQWQQNHPKQPDNPLTLADVTPTLVEDSKFSVEDPIVVEKAKRGRKTASTKTETEE